jgi:hypothetical protein
VCCPGEGEAAGGDAYPDASAVVEYFCSRVPALRAPPDMLRPLAMQPRAFLALVRRAPELPAFCDLQYLTRTASLRCQWQPCC